MVKMIKATIDQPVEATLVWRMEDGQNIHADIDNLRKAGYVHAPSVYSQFETRLIEAFDAAELFDAEHGDISECEINPLRYMVEVVLHYPNHFAQFPTEMDEAMQEIVALEKSLRKGAGQ